MPKKLKKPGSRPSHKASADMKSILASAEIQNVSPFGLWLLVNGQEFYLPFIDFPWFLKGTIQQIFNVEFFHGHHLHWPDLDVDIDVDALKNPEKYPLRYQE